MLTEAKINDDVFGEMTWDQGWEKYFTTDINGYECEYLMCVDALDSEDEITPEQKEHYKKYFENEQKFKEEYPKALLKFYKDNYAIISENWDDAYDLDCIDEETVKNLVDFDTLYFSDGEKYGWVCSCAWEDSLGDDYRSIAIYFDDTVEGICVGTVDDLYI